MDTLALALSRKIKKMAPEDTGSVAVMTYSLTILLNTVLVLCCSLLFGWFLGQVLDTLIAFLSFIALRLFSGGRHFKSSVACNVTTVAVCVLIPAISALISSELCVLITIFGAIVMCIFAPRPDKRSLLPRRWFPFFKVTAVFLVSLNFQLNSPVIALCALTQALTIIPFGKEGEV